MKHLIFILLVLFSCGDCLAGQDIYKLKEGGSEYLISLGQTDILNANIAALESKTTRTGTEENLLKLSLKVKENSSYFDEAALKDFNDAVYIMRILEERNLPMKEGMAAGLAAAVKEEQVIYNDYLKATAEHYKKINKLLCGEEDLKR